MTPPMPPTKQTPAVQKYKDNNSNQKENNNILKDQFQIPKAPIK